LFPAQQGESVLALMAKNRWLEARKLLSSRIADAHKPSGIAGISGQ